MGNSLKQTTEIIIQIADLNSNNEVSGILLNFTSLPNRRKMLRCIDVKDVDGVTCLGFEICLWVKKLWLMYSTRNYETLGIHQLDIEGKHAVVGRSPILESHGYGAS